MDQVSSILGRRYAAWRGSALAAVSRAAVVGLALSIAVLVIVISVINGFERELQTRVLGMTAHATVTARQGMLHDPALAPALMSSAGITGVSDFVSATALLIAGDQVAGLQIMGIPPETYGAVSRLPEFIGDQQLGVLRPGEFGIAIGAVAARRLGVAPGDAVNVVVPAPDATVVGLRNRQKRFRVLMLVESGSEVDARIAYVHIQDAQRLFRRGARIDGVQLRLTDPFELEQARNAVINAFDTRDVYFTPWTRMHGNLYQAIATQKLTMFVLLSFLVAVAAFNLVSGLVMVVDQRREDIAILRAMGAGDRTLRRAFVSLGVRIGGFGIAAGLVCGVVIALLLPGAFRWLSQWTETELMSQYFIHYLPVEVRTLDLLSIAVTAGVLCFVSTLWPAARASAMRPVEVLRHE